MTGGGLKGLAINGSCPKGQKSDGMSCWEDLKLTCTPVVTKNIDNFDNTLHFTTSGGDCTYTPPQIKGTTKNGSCPKGQIVEDK